MSVATLLSVPRAKGLFHRAIVQSGTAHNVTSPATAHRIGRRLAEKLSIAEEMRDKAVRSLMKSDRDYDWDHPNGSQVDDIRQLIHSVPHPRCGKMAVTSTSIM
jgi:carboxylesterase type B